MNHNCMLCNKIMNKKYQNINMAMKLPKKLK